MFRPFFVLVLGVYLVFQRIHGQSMTTRVQYFVAQPGICANKEDAEIEEVQVGNNLEKDVSRYASDRWRLIHLDAHVW